MAPEIIVGIVSAKNFDDGSQHSVAHEVGGEDLAVEPFATIQPGQAGVQADAQKRLVNLRWMDGNSFRLVVAGKPDGPWHIRRPAIATPIHQAAESAEEIAKSDA